MFEECRNTCKHLKSWLGSMGVFRADLNRSIATIDNLLGGRGDLEKHLVTYLINGWVLEMIKTQYKIFSRDHHSQNTSIYDVRDHRKGGFHFPCNKVHDSVG